MTRRAWLAASGVLALGGAMRVHAAVPKVGILFIGKGDGSTKQAIVAGLRDFGWIDEQNIEIVWRFGEGNAERLPALAADLVAQRVNVIVAVTPIEIKAAAEATTTIPIVMGHGLDPVGRGLARSLRRPGGNVTGMTWDQDPELTGKYLELLAEVIPGLRRVGCLIDAQWPGILRYKYVFDRVAAARRIAVNTIDVRSPEDIDRAVPALAEGGAQAVFVYGSALANVHQRRIIDLMVRHALPDIGVFDETVRAGGLMAYGASFAALNRRSGYFIDRILRRTSPGDIPIEMPTQYELWINRRRAKVLGLNLSASLLARADQVIE